MKRTLILLAVAMLTLSACAPGAAPTPSPTTAALLPTDTPAPAATPTPAPSPTATFTATPAPTATPTATPTHTPSPTATPTATLTVTPTAIPTLPPEQVGGLSGVPDPRYSNPELFDLNDPDAPITQFVNAMQMAGVAMEGENLNIHYLVVRDKLIGYIEIYTRALPVELSGRYPVLVYDQTIKSFRQFYWPDLATVDISAFFNTAEDVEALKRNPAIYRNYTFATVPFAWSYDKQQNGLRDLNYRLSGVRIRNFPIMVGGGLDVDPFANTSITYEELMSELEEQMLFIKSHIKPRIFCVLNEIHPGTPYFSLFARFGERFIIDVYSKAREIFDADTILIYNETYNYAKTTAYWDDTKRFLDLLNSQGFEISGGMQMHINQYPDHGEVIPNESDIQEAINILYILPNSM